MRLKSLLLVIILSPVLINAQDRFLKNASIEEVATLLEKEISVNVYYNNADSTARFNIAYNIETLKRDVTTGLRNDGYILSEYGGNLFIFKDIGLSTELPSGYFASLKKDDRRDEVQSEKYIQAINNRTETVTFSSKVYEIGDKTIKNSSSKAFLSGYIRNISTGEPIDAYIYDANTRYYVESDENGFYKIELPLRENRLIIGGGTFEEIELQVVMYGDGALNIPVNEISHTLAASSISAESVDVLRKSQLGVEIVRIERIKQVPTVFGEADVIKIVLTLPGVKSVGEAASGFNVRGGATDQNLILFNDNTIYNPSHMFGLFSSFNPDIVRDIELYKSSIPARYGGRLSSVLEVNSREGSNDKVKGSLGLGLLTSKIHLEGPLKKDVTTFLLGGRTTYSNWILNLLPENSSDEFKRASAYFGDMNLKVTHKFNNKNTISLNTYLSKDDFKFNPDTSFNSMNINASLIFKRQIDENKAMTVSGGYDDYRYENIDKGMKYSSYKLKFNIKQAFLKADMRWKVSDKHALSYGINSTLYNLSPGSYLPYDHLSKIMPKRLDKESAIEGALYLSDDWEISDKLMTTLGLRYSLYSSFNSPKLYGGPEIRASMRYMISNNISVKAGINSMRQYIHMLSNSVNISPTDIWKLSDQNIRPQTGWQAATGFFATLFDKKVDLSIEGYYKRMDRYLDYKSGAILIMNDNIAEDVLETIGRSYGVEVMLRKVLGKLNGWVTYTYSRTQLKEDSDRGILAINRGNWYNTSYDKPHDVKLVGNYKFTHRYSVSFNLDYSTGRPVTVPIGKYVYDNGYRLVYSDRNQYRIPDYFRMDLAVNIEPGHRLTKLTHFSITFGVYNVTSRKNAYSVFYDTNRGEGVAGYMMTIFEVPIPYININMKF